MSWTRSCSVPLGRSGPRALRLDQEGQEGHGRDRAGHDGRDLRRGDERALPNGSDGQGGGRALLRGEHGGALRQELDVSTDLLDLGTEPNPWWSAGVQQEHLREARQLAMEQPMWTPREEVSVKEDLPEIEDADASRELEPLAMGRMSAPSSWSTRRGVALQTQGAMPSNDDEDLRYPQDAGQGQHAVQIQGVDLRHPQDAGQGRREVHPQGVDLRQYSQDVGQGQGMQDTLKVLDQFRREVHSQGVDLRYPQDAGQGQRAGHPQGVEQCGHPQGVDLRYPQDAGQGQRAGHPQGAEQCGHPQGVRRDGHPQGVEQVRHPQGVDQVRHPQGVDQDEHPQGVEQVGHHRGVAAGLLAGEVQRSGKGHG